MSIYFHAIATLPGGRRKSIVNKAEDQMLSEFVTPYVSTGVIRAKWGKSMQSYQVLELRIVATKTAWDKKSGIGLDKFLGKAKNRFSTFERRAKDSLSTKVHRVFIVMPIQGEAYGTQDQQRIWKEYDSRFETLEKLLGKMNCVAIRIDREHALSDLVRRIKDEISRSKFVIADLTDERPSCYFEAGYAEALQKPTIFVASKESVVNPKTPTRIHFDIHQNVNFFSNSTELQQKVRSAIEKNSKELFGEEE